jgi:hypothetical protein
MVSSSMLRTGFQDEPNLVSRGPDRETFTLSPLFADTSLDSIGLAGFYHDFGTLSDQKSAVSDVFDAFAYLKMTMASLVQFLIAPSMPVVLRIPTQHTGLLYKFKKATDAVAKSLLEKGVEDAKGHTENVKANKSVIGLLSTCARVVSPKKPYRSSRSQSTDNRNRLSPQRRRS